MMKPEGKRRYFLFFLILAAGIVLLSAGAELLARTNPERLRTRNLNYSLLKKEKENSIDVLVAGDSESYSSVSPMDLWEKFGITAYDIGQSGQQIQGTYYMLKTAFQTQSPKLVLLEGNTIFRNPGELKYFENLLLEELGYYVPVFRYHNMWETFVTGERDWRVTYKGFKIRTKIDPYMDGDYMVETEKSKDISPFVEKYLKKIIRLCEAHGAELMLYSAPSPKNHTFKRHNKLMEISEETGIPYLDLNMRIDELKILWDEDSLDGGDHLNLSGAVKVTEWLGDYLTDQYDLPDHRGDDQYADWDALLAEYRKAVEEETAEDASDEDEPDEADMEA